MRRRGLGTGLALALAGAGLACGGGPGGRAPARAERESPFPSRDDLRDLARRPAPEAPKEATFAEVESWTLAGPLPDAIGEEPIADPSPWEELLLETSRGRAGLLVASEAMRCAAREFGRFYLAHGAFPADALRRFVLGRCGATGAELEGANIAGRLPPGVDEAAVFESWRDDAAELLRSRIGTGPRAAGVWFGRRGEEGFLLVVSAGRRVHLEPTSAVPDPDGALRLRGEVLIPTSELQAFANRGRFGVERCQRDDALRPPRFAFTCPTQPEDSAAWISVVARSPGRLLSEGVLLALARPSGEPAATFRLPSYGRPAPVSSADEFDERLLEEINRVRSQAGASPLVFEVEESAVARQLAPFYFASQLGEMEATVSDVVALGLMAGWEVAGPIRDAGVGGALAQQTADFDRWLSTALEQPSLRSLLLDPSRSRLAVGPMVSGEPAYLAALVATYQLFGGEDPAALRRAFYARLRRAYRERGATPPRRQLDVEEAAARWAARVQAGAATPDRALDRLLQESVAFLAVQANGWLLEGSSPDDVPLPEALFEPRWRRVGAAVAHYQPEGEPWGRLVVLLVAAPDAALRTTSAP